MKIFRILFSTTILFFTCCTKERKPSTPEKQPQITSVELTNYCAGTVTIKGNNFDTLISHDSVFFGNIKGIINSVRPTEVIATLPAYIISGPVQFYNGNFFTTSQMFINRGTTVIDSIGPAIAGTGTILTIYGKFFNEDPTLDSVYFNNIKASVLSATANKITVTVPPGATSGILSLKSNCQSAVASTLFTNINKGSVYIGTNGQYFYAIDITSGMPKWMFAMRGGGSNSPAYNNGMIYLGSGYDSVFYAINAESGKEIWRFSAGYWEGTPVVSAGTVYMGCRNGIVYALDAGTGTVNWAFSAGGDIQSGPTLYSGVLYSASGNGNLYAINAATGILVWKRNIYARGNPSVVNGIVYSSGLDSLGQTGELYALDAASGSIHWVLPVANNHSPVSPTVVNGVVYTGAVNTPFYAVDAVSGSVIWQTTSAYNIYSAAQVINNMVYITGGGGSLYTLDALTSNLLWQTTLDPFILYQAGPVVADGCVYAGGDAGNVYNIDAVSGKINWIFNTSGYPVYSNPVVVDQNGNVFNAGDSGQQP